MSLKTKRWMKFAPRWMIAAAGIAFVLWKIDFHDHVTVLHPGDGRPISVRVLGEASETDGVLRILLPLPGRHGGELVEREVLREELWLDPDVRHSGLLPEPGGGDVQPGTTYRLLAAKPGAPAPRPGASHGRREAARLLVEHPETKALTVVAPRVVAEEQARYVSSPLVQAGILRLVRHADLTFLLAALGILPLNFLITSYRWNLLLEAVGVHIGRGRTFVINMVGAFYNSFMPGSTGGDLVKAYYVAGHTDRRAPAVMSVLVDRCIGLLALIILAFAAAALQWKVRECARVAVTCGGLLLLATVGLLVVYQPALLRATGVDLVFKRLPFQEHVRKAIEAMNVYRRRPLVPLAALLMSIPVHMITVVSASLAGWAFDLPLGPAYYWVIVPVVALSGALPISPQGAGVMEFTAIALTEPLGATPGQAVALAMFIRLGQVFWNLAAGFFVFRGGYHAVATETRRAGLQDREPVAEKVEEKTLEQCQDGDDRALEAWPLG